MKFFTLHKNTDYSDEDLLTMFKESENTEYFGMLYNRYIPLVYGLCLKYFQNPVQAEDAVMDIFETLVHKILNYDIVVFRTWLYSVVKNHCFNKLKLKTREIVIDSDSFVMESEPMIDLYDNDIDERRAEALSFCMTKLTEEQRISIEKFFYKKKSYAEIVEVTGYDLKSVKSYLQNGKRNLKNCIENRLKVEE